ncbi:MAG: NYN domain-containing protein [Minisyncoccia bacterium]
MYKIVALIDGVSLYSTSKALGFDVDFKRLLEWLRREKGSLLVRAYYFTLIEDTGEYSSLRPLADWLEYNGFSMVTKPAKVRSDGRRKGSMHVELAVVAMELAQTINHIVLFTGDGEYVALVEALKRQGVVVTLVSSLVTEPPTVDDLLRRTADDFIELDRIAKVIERQRT